MFNSRTTSNHGTSSRGNQGNGETGKRSWSWREKRRRGADFDTCYASGATVIGAIGAVCGTVEQSCAKCFPPVVVEWRVSIACKWSDGATVSAVVWCGVAARGDDGTGSASSGREWC